mmetsp:Transcript_15905/g.36545  ORF Transcript_15905/g.36545 Transcript_15905/m.36545 type:complete len:245 (+) Transcript_15905:129-863(+)
MKLFGGGKKVRRNNKKGKHSGGGGEVEEQPHTEPTVGNEPPAVQNVPGPVPAANYIVTEAPVATTPDLKNPPPHEPQQQQEPPAPQQQHHESSISQTLAASLNLEEEAERNAVTRELVKKFVADIWNRGDLELIPEVCSRSLRFNGSVGMDRVGHEGFARMVTTIRDALNDYHCEIHSMVVEGNKAFCRMRFTGRHTGPLLGYAPTGRQVAWMGAAEFTCKNGLIVKVWELGDVKSLEEQLSGA